MMTAKGGNSTMNKQTADPLNPIAARSRREEGFARQAPRRAAEDSARRHTAAVCEELATRGHRRYQVSSCLHISGRTLCRWCHLRLRPPCPLPRGRPCKESSPVDRRAVLRCFELEGPHVGLPTLRDKFPNMPRCELAELQADYRQHFRASHRLPREDLTWHVAGTVWAMDHSWPPGPVDGVAVAILSVRDLGSGMQLYWQAVPDETAATTAATLERLIRKYGAPLIIKSDNGSAFKSEELQHLLAEHRIIWLPSPPRMPWYNGGCEAGNCTMKAETNTQAYLLGDSGNWTSDLMEVARQRANQSTHPRDKLKTTHAQRWVSRPTITEQDRDRLETLIRMHQRAIIETMSEFNPRNQNHKHKVLRLAVRRAMLDAGLLTITRRSITPPLKRQNWAKIS